jgi:hypothetical protein
MSILTPFGINPVIFGIAPDFRMAGMGAKPKSDEEQPKVAAVMRPVAGPTGGRGVTSSAAEKSVNEWLEVIKAEQETVKKAKEEESQAEPPDAPVSPDNSQGAPPAAAPGPANQQPDIQPNDVYNQVRSILLQAPELLNQQHQQDMQRRLLTATLRDRGLRELSRRRIEEQNIAAWRDLNVARTQAQSNQAIALMNTAYLSMIPNSNLIQAMNEATKAGMTALTVPATTVRYTAS